MNQPTEGGASAEPAELRREMVENQLKARGIKDSRVLQAMAGLPRHEFIPNPDIELAYGDFPMPIGWGQTISQPYMVARMTELLALTGSEKILEIGTGSGYQTALLSMLAKRVVSVERVRQIHELAAKNLEKYGNIRLVLGDGTLGFIEEAPYDRILVTAGAPNLPSAFIDQLAEGGLCVIPVGDRGTQVLKVIRKQDGRISGTDDTYCIFVPLIGKNGWDG